MFLLDTVAISEFHKLARNSGLEQWLMQTPDDAQFVSILSLGEIDAGIHAMASGRRRERLEAWAAGLTELFDGHVLGFDLDTARIWGRKLADLRKKGVTVPMVDVMIAATAIQHGQTVVTRNARHFEWCGVAVLNPWV